VIKSAFWLFILLVGITLFVPLPDDETRQGHSYSHLDTLSALRGTLADLSGFCDRNQETCATGRYFFSSLGTRARDGAGMLYQFLDRQFAAQEISEPQADTEIQ